MVKQTNYIKETWFKNDDDKGGAMNDAISIKKSNEICILSHTKKMGRLWTSIDPNKFINLLHKNYGLYEIITNFPHKMYFDIDKKGDNISPTFLQDIKQTILQYFPNAEMAISGSIKTEKTSYHIVLQNYVIHNVEEQTTIKHIIKYLQTKEDSFDWKVYTKNRNMKCINQSKEDGRVQEIIENDDFKAHCITCFLPTYSLPFSILENIPFEVKEHIAIEKSKSTFDIGALPKLNLSMNTDKSFNELTNLEILQLLPINKSFDHSYTHLVARFCFYNDLSFETFLAWLKPKHIEKNKNLEEEFKRWIWHWGRLDKFPRVSSDKIKNILCYFYPNLKKDPSYRIFNDTFNFPQSLVTKIPTISQKEFNGEEKYSIFNVGMGGGKTHQTVEYLKNQSSFCWIAPNRALAHNTFNRLEDSNIDIHHYSNINTKDKKNGGLKQFNKLIIVANSLHYLEDTTYDVLVIDEVETLIDKWFGNFMQNKTENWNTFLNIIRKAKKVILLDAFITTKTLNLINNFDPKEDIKIYERLYEPSTRTINYVADFEKMISSIIDDLKNGLKLFIFYPYKNQSKMYENVISMKGLYDLLVASTGKQGIFYNADIDEKIKVGLKNVNNAWANKSFIITNSIITCGVNYETEDFDKEYLFVSSFSIPRDVIQVSYRPRFLSSGIINVCYVGKMQQTNTWETDTHLLTCPIYKKLIHSVLIEKKSPLKKTFQLFCVKANYKQITDKEKINKQLQDEISEMLQKHANGFSYENIEDIDFSYEEIIQQKLFAGEATMREKFMLQKYHFKKKFVDEATLANFSEFGDYGDNNCLENAWNSQYLFFFNQIRNHLSKGSNCIFQKIKDHNELENIFTFDIKKVKLSDDIKSQIFNEFKFKYISQSSSNLKIIHEIYNTFFGVKIIQTTYTETSKAVNYSIDPTWNIWLQFVTKYNKEQYVEVSANGHDCDFD
jgi:hypothetical protein